MKKKEDFVFLFILDEAYVRYLELGVRSINTFYPDAVIHVFDLTESPSFEICKLYDRYSQICLHHFPSSEWELVPFADKVDFDYFFPGWGFLDQIKYLSRRIRNKIFGINKYGWILNKDDFLSRKRRAIRIWGQKAGCIKKVLLEEGRTVVFMDADAVLWDRVDDAFSYDYDVALTLRPISKVKVGIDKGVNSSKELPYHAVNAGVIFIRPTSQGRAFVDAWINEMKQVEYFMIEQTALSLLALKADKDIFKQYEKESTLFANGEHIKLIMLPCSRYNNTDVSPSSAEDFSFVAIAHFKGYLKDPKWLSQIEKMLEDRLSKNSK